MKKKKILYIMNVSWNWIKQRPHYIAEELSKDYEVDVVFLKSFVNDVKNTNQSNISGKLIEARRLPFQRISHLPILKSIYNYIDKKLFASSLPCRYSEYSYIWLTSPMIKFLPSNLSVPIIYDCMDDNVAMSKEGSSRSYVKNEEFKLYKKASLIFCSAEYLSEILKKRYGFKLIYILNNAVSTNLLKNVRKLKEKPKEEKFIITYIGTISHWFDFDLLRKTVNDFPFVSFQIYGPNDIELPEIQRVNYCGILPHEKVFEIMTNSDALIMPFIINDIIKSVNPVKLYEYIYSLKPIFAPRYNESLYFEKFVELYSDYKEFKELLTKVIKNSYKIDSEERISFIEQNTWEYRYKEIKKYLSTI